MTLASTVGTEAPRPIQQSARQHRRSQLSQKEVQRPRVWSVASGDAGARTEGAKLESLQESCLVWFGFRDGSHLRISARPLTSLSYQYDDQPCRHWRRSCDNPNNQRRHSTHGSLPSLTARSLASGLSGPRPLSSGAPLPQRLVSSTRRKIPSSGAPVLLTNFFLGSFRAVQAGMGPSASPSSPPPRKWKLRPHGDTR